MKHIWLSVILAATTLTLPFWQEKEEGLLAISPGNEKPTEAEKSAQQVSSLREDANPKSSPDSPNASLEEPSQKKPRSVPSDREGKDKDSTVSSDIKTRKQGDSSVDARREEKKPKSIPADQIVLQGQGGSKTAALTFDDGPDARYTGEVLDLLREEGVKATFFVVGQEVRQHPDVLRRIDREGHKIGNHTWSHPFLPKLTDTKVQEELDKTDREVARLTGRRMTLMRPPYGAYQGVEKAILSRSYRIINWSVDSLDWRKGRGATVIEQHVTNAVRPGAIILHHSGGGDRSATVKAVKKEIRYLKKKGYRLVTVDEMLGIPAYREANSH
ncbi:polysaccharide deacetylase family protein [Salinithrix halophila]|uniref:Polysaccharide deacetylase family protein n=1 Tax=Salinithrix halophila TaxID=1485204 RepID=A0ABV8JF26_9BACL